MRMEGKNYYVEAYDKANAKLGFGGGRGMLNLMPKGYNDVYFKKYDDHVTSSKPTVLVRNILIGNVYIDIDLDSTYISHKTGVKVVLKFHVK